MKKIIAVIAVTAAIALGGCIKVSTTPPTDLPAYVKIMPGSHEFVTMDMGALKAQAFQVTNSTDDVLAFYRAQAQSDGLVEQPNAQQSASDPTQKQVTFGDPSGKMLIVVTKPQSGETLVTLMYKPSAGGGAAAPTNATGS
jgi:hypothetical protein